MIRTAVKPLRNGWKNGNSIFITIKIVFMGSKLWFTRTFKDMMDLPQQRKYEGFCEGWVAYQDQNIDNPNHPNPPDEWHKVSFDWDHSRKVLSVYLDPFDGDDQPAVTA